jgi:hypothetical protein
MRDYLIAFQRTRLHMYFGDLPDEFLPKVKRILGGT